MISQRSKVIDTLPAVQRKVMEVDYFSYIELTRLLLPHFQQRQTGHFVVISSVMGKIGTPMRSAYAAAKHALHGFFDCLRAEVWTFNCKVTIITPGYIRTNVSRNAVTATGDKLNNLGKNIGNGYPPDKTARQILRAVEKGKYEKVCWKAAFSGAAGNCTDALRSEHCDRDLQKSNAGIISAWLAFAELFKVQQALFKLFLQCFVEHWSHQSSHWIGKLSIILPGDLRFHIPPFFELPVITGAGFPGLDELEVEVNMFVIDIA